MALVAAPMGRSGGRGSGAGGGGRVPNPPRGCYSPSRWWGTAGRTALAGRFP